MSKKAKVNNVKAIDIVTALLQVASGDTEASVFPTKWTRRRVDGTKVVVRCSGSYTSARQAAKACAAGNDEAVLITKQAEGYAVRDNKSGHTGHEAEVILSVIVSQADTMGAESQPDEGETQAEANEATA